MLTFCPIFSLSIWQVTPLSPIVSIGRLSSTVKLSYLVPLVRTSLRRPPAPATVDIPDFSFFFSVYTLLSDFLFPFRETWETPPLLPVDRAFFLAHWTPSRDFADSRRCDRC